MYDGRASASHCDRIKICSRQDMYPGLRLIHTAEAICDFFRTAIFCGCLNEPLPAWLMFKVEKQTS